MLPIRSGSPSVRLAALLFFVFGALIAGGCSSSNKKVNVSGQVTYKGQPVRPGIVQFYDAQGTILSMAELNANGSFTATDLLPGEVQVTVRQLPNIGIPTKEGDAPTRMRKPIPIPTKYQDAATSGLHYTIGSGANRLKIELQ